MSPNSNFYPAQKVVEINPLQPGKRLSYILEGVTDASRETFRLKFAFPAKLDIKSPQLKNTIRNILVSIIDASNFTVTPSGKKLLIDVPVSTIQDASELPGQGEIKVPILIKLAKVADANEPATEFKCVQEILLITDASESEEEEEEEEEDEEEEDEDEDEEEEEDDEDEDEDEDEEEKTSQEDTDDELPKDAGLYSGLVAIDYGTSNSSVSVRDPSFAAEEVRGQLSEEQWNALCEWMDIWLSEHLSKLDPTDLDLFVQNLTLVVPASQIPQCGSPKSEIQQSLQRLDDKMRIEMLKELLRRLANYVKDGGEARNMKALAAETMFGFEAVIDANTLESQRYFVLELDKNVGPAPISSVLQIVELPGSDDIETLENETNVDMGARVGLLLHSAALGEIDIRQFVLSSKRYFGSDDSLEIVPAKGGSEPRDVPGSILAKLTYRELFKRAVADIHRRADQGMFQDASWPQSVVATFPTSYPAVLRKTIREILSDLEIKEVDTRFDEATAAAIYYIWREIGADPVCGMHGLMARSRKDKYGRAYQNILLYDLGGGTTDIALIQLFYEELPIFDEGDDRGNGGCYFRITPRLLGTTGHRYLGGDLLTLWVFRLMKAKLADLLLSYITNKNIEPPMDTPLNQLLFDLPDQIIEGGGNAEEGFEETAARYRQGSLLEWTLHPAQYLREYNRLNDKVIDVLVPTRFAEDRSRVPNFFTLWEICDELKKTLGTPIVEHFGTCLDTGLAKNWPEELEVDSGQLFHFVQMIHPWIVDGGHIQQDDLRMAITQEEMNNVLHDTVKQSISLAASLAQARLITQDRRDRVDRFILAGLSCNMKVIQDVAEEVFRQSNGLFDYDPANVRFDKDSAKTAVSLGACIGRYMESVRVDPFNEKTRQLLRDGYDQIELVIENLFSYLPCRIAYDSLVAMVPIFEQGQELNVKSYWDRDRIVARTSIKDLRPVQEKFWIYRIDFPGAEPQYLGLINAEAVAQANGFEDFRKFREEYVVGFEADAELMIRCFFLPKGQIIKASEYVEPLEEGDSIQELIVPSGSRPMSKKEYQPRGQEEEEEESEEENEEEEEMEDTESENEEEPESEAEEEEEKEEEVQAPVAKPRSRRSIKNHDEDRPRLQMGQTIFVREPLDELPAIKVGEELSYRVEYGEGGASKYCSLSQSLTIREDYEFKVFDTESQEASESMDPNDEGKLVARFQIDDDATDEATFIVDQDGKTIMMTKCLFDIEIYADIEFTAQKVDINFNPFCGQH